MEEKETSLSRSLQSSLLGCSLLFQL